MSTNSKMCPMPFTSMHIDGDGRIKICCADNPDSSPTDQNGIEYNVSTHKLDDFWNSDYIKNVRKQFLNGEKPSSCKNCWNTERNLKNPISVRTESINRFDESGFNYNNNINSCNKNGELNSPPIDFQVMSGNLCNLGCKMCSPDYSSNFSKFFKSKGFSTANSIQFHKKQPKGFFPNKNYNIIHDWPKTIELKNVFKNYENNISYMFITGGEPTIIPENVDFLDFLSNKNINLRLATNCTNINKKLLNSIYILI